MAKESRNKGEGGRKVSFWKGVKSEYSKIIWTDKKTLGRQTAAVVIISAIVCAMITLVDSLGLQIMELLMR